ncbi:MAG TPA: cytochrome c oxidase assembly protein, partial [Acidimicrobiales bacterium]|nr:cytochrome c oxidase assembly protein [Acidimicrobiales bacterium]
LAMWHMDLMDLVNVLFLLGGLLFWWPMVGLDPIVHWKMTYPMRMLNILLGTGLEAFLGVAILNQSQPVASMYTLASTHAGGGLLWVSTEIVTLGAFVPIYRQWVKSEDRAAARFDAASVRQLAQAREEAAAGVVPAVATPGRGAMTAAEAADLSLWELEWLRRTGRMPRRDVGLEDTVAAPELP